MKPLQDRIHRSATHTIVRVAALAGAATLLAVPSNGWAGSIRAWTLDGDGVWVLGPASSESSPAVGANSPEGERIEAGSLQRLAMPAPAPPSALDGLLERERERAKVRYAKIRDRLERASNLEQREERERDATRVEHRKGSKSKARGKPAVDRCGMPPPDGGERPRLLVLDRHRPSTGAVCGKR